MEKWSLKENGKNENICFKIYICKKSITYFVPQMMAAGTGMAGDVAAMAASASVHSQPMAPGDMQVWQSGFLFWLFSALSSLSQLSQEEGDRKTNLIVNYLPQTMTQVRPCPSSDVRFSPTWGWSFHSYVKAIRRKGFNEITPLEQAAVLVKCCGKESHKILILPQFFPGVYSTHNIYFYQYRRCW